MRESGRRTFSSPDVTMLFYLLHLRAGVECGDADVLCGSCQHAPPIVREMSQLRPFRQSKGYRRAPITVEWLEEAAALYATVAAMEATKTEFGRVVRGLKILFYGLKEERGDNRLHQCVRSLEALILPDIAKTKRQFAHRCQTFTRPDDDTRALLLEAFDMRSDTEHVHEWDEAVQQYPAEERDNVCWQRTRQMEALACHAYSQLLRDANIREHFRTDDSIAAFWKLQDHERRALWGLVLDIGQVALVKTYDGFGRATA